MDNKMNPSSEKSVENVVHWKSVCELALTVCEEVKNLSFCPLTTSCGIHAAIRLCNPPPRDQ